MIFPGKNFFAVAVLAGVIFAGEFVEKELRHLQRIHEDFPAGVVLHASADYFSAPNKRAVYANCLSDHPCTTTLALDDTTGDFPESTGQQRVLVDGWDGRGRWRVWREPSGEFTGLYICQFARVSYFVQGENLSAVTTNVQQGYAMCPEGKQ